MKNLILMQNIKNHQLITQFKKACVVYYYTHVYIFVIKLNRERHYVLTCAFIFHKYLSNLK